MFVLLCSHHYGRGRLGRVEIVTRRFREQKHLRAQSTAGYPGTLGWKPFDDVTGVECDVLGQQVPRQTLDDHSTVINFLE